MTDLFDLAAARLMSGGGSPAVLTEKSVTANGTYSAASDNADGYSSVTVAVPELPVTFLKSIKSVGNSIIVTDIVPDYDWEIFMDVKFENPTYTQTLSGYDCLFGKRITGDMMAVAFAKWDASTPTDFVAYSGYAPTSGTVYSTHIQNSDIGIRNSLVARRGAGECIYGSSSFAMSGTITGTSTNPVAIFGITQDNDTLSPYGKYDMTMYSMEMFDGSGQLAHTLVPAKSKATSRSGLYDLTTNKFYPSHADYDDFITEV